MAYSSCSTPWSRLTDERQPGCEVRTICIIGAGASGLVSAKHLRDAGYEVTVLEKDDEIGGAFVTKAYDESRLVSSKYLTTFSDLRATEEDPPHVSLPAYVEYLRRYADQEDLWRLIHFSVHVKYIERLGNGYHVHTTSAKTDKSASKNSPMHFDAVCVCSGLHEAPYVPPVDGLDAFKGDCVLHSAQYKDRNVFTGKRVLVVGCGETGMDLAYRAVLEADSVGMSIRNGFLSVPHEGWGGQPLDTFITNLFEHSYEHRWCHAIHLKWKVTTIVIRLMFLLTTGCTQGYNQWVGGVKVVKRGYHILCKSTAAMPYLNRPYKQATWRSRLWARLFAFAEPSVDRSIHAFPAIERVRGRTVHFVDGKTFEADVIVLATGYRQTFPFLHAPSYGMPRKDGADTRRKRRSRSRSPNRRSDAEGAPPVTQAADAMGVAMSPCGGMDKTASWRAGTGARGAEDPLPPEHFIISPEEPTLAFVGFVRPNVGAIPPMSELQVMWWIERLRGNVTKPAEPASYGLLGKKLTYGVDYGNYMHQLAAEFGAAPSLWTLRRSPRALIAYSLGQAYISFFRLQGPFQSEHAWKTAEGELFRPVVARGLFENLVFLATTLVFGSMNVCAYTLELPILLLSTVCRVLLVWPWKALLGIGRSLTGSDGTLRGLHALTGSELSKKL